MIDPNAQARQIIEQAAMIGRLDADDLTASMSPETLLRMSQEQADAISALRTALVGPREPGSQISDTLALRGHLRRRAFHRLRDLDAEDEPIPYTLTSR